jgi:hypothetical protein
LGKRQRKKKMSTIKKPALILNDDWFRSDFLGLESSDFFGRVPPPRAAIWTEESAQPTPSFLGGVQFWFAPPLHPPWGRTRAKAMGHRKIDISPILNERQRQETFAKRKLGVMKKATELSILCNANVAIIVFSANNKMSVYSSCPINTLVQRYLETRESAEVCPAGWPPLAGD